MRRATALRSCRCFTLVEMLTAVALLVVIMGLLFQILSKAQQAWSLAETQRRIYERAQIVFEMAGRDVMCAVASAVPGRRIPLWVNANQTNAAREVWADQDVFSVVSYGPASNDDAKARLNEVRYSLFLDQDFNDSGHPDEEFVLRRAITSDRLSGGATNPDWDFLGAQTAAWVATAASGRHPVVDGVWSFRVTPFPAVSGNTFTQPAAIQVRVELFDPKALRAPTTTLRDAQIAQTKRQFTKMIFLPAR